MLAQYPTIEDFQVQGLENSNLVNVLLDADSDISDFYGITDQGLIYDIKFIGGITEIDLVLNVKGTIPEAFTYDSVHYISTNSKGSCYLIRTKDFITIDTILSESQTTINDFRIYNDSLFALTESEGESSVMHKSLNGSVWAELAVTYQGYNRIVKIDNYIYLYKYLEDDISLLRNINLTEEWEFIDFEHIELQNYSRIKVRDTVLYVCGKIEFVGSVVLLNKNLVVPTYYGLTGPIGETTLNDFELHHDFDFKFNRRNNYQVGQSETEGVGAFFHKSVFSGNGKDNKTLFPSSSSLNRIISNDFSQYKEFIAVGNSGLVLLIDRGATSIENDYWQGKDDSFSFYPNPVTSQKLLTVTSEEIIHNISIIDISGRELINHRFISGYEFSIPVSSLFRGVYFLQVNGQTQKFVVE